MSATDLYATLETLVAALHHQNINYFITGSVASSVHGEYRATNDVDIVADIVPETAAALVDELEKEFVADAQQARDAIGSGSSFNLIHRHTFLKIDVFPCVTALDREALRRADAIALPGAVQPLRVATAEDVLLAKLRWYALGDEQSEVQRRDIRALISLNRPSLDLAYARSWSATLGLAPLLERFLGEPG